jgi:hypothetical protein
LRSYGLQLDLDLRSPVSLHGNVDLVPWQDYL